METEVEMKLLTAAFLAAHAPDEDWIVCLGETRTVLSGRVTCPLRGPRQASRRECAACRHLEWQRDERRHGATCSTDATMTSDCPITAGHLPSAP